MSRGKAHRPRGAARNDGPGRNSRSLPRCHALHDRSHDHPERRQRPSRSSASASSRSPPEETAAAVDRGLRGRLPAHRHRRDVRQRGRASARRSRASGHRPRRAVHHQQAQQRLPPARRRPHGVRRDAGDAAAWTTSTCSSSTGRCRRGTTATSSRPGGRWRSSSATAAPRSIGVSNFQPAAPRPARRRDRRGAGGQPDRGAPVLHQRARSAPYDAAHGIVIEAWSPIAQGKVLDDPVIIEIAGEVGKTPRRSSCAGTSSAATSSSRSRCTPERMRGELRASSTSSSTHDDMDADHRAGPGRGRPHRPEPGHVRLHPGLSRLSRSGRGPRWTSSRCRCRRPGTG